MQTELTHPGHLLQPNGSLAQIGWSSQPLLDCNLEAAHFYALPALQRFRLKRWDYYAIFTPQRFFSATIADLGYAPRGRSRAWDLLLGSQQNVENKQ